MTKSTEVSTDWKAALKEQIQKEVVRKESSDGIPHISLRHGRMVLNDEPIPGDKIECVILGYTYEKAWYDRVFDPDDVAPPNCFGLGPNKYEMVPHKNVVNPPSSACSDCPWAEFGTAIQGKGPACKTRLRLVVLAVSQDLTGSLSEPKLAMLKVSPTSVSNFDAVGNKTKPQGHLRNLADADQAYWSAVTEISMSMAKKGGYGIVNFKLARPIVDDKVLASLYKMTVDVAKDDLHRAWTYEDDESKPAPEQTAAEKAVGARF